MLLEKLDVQNTDAKIIIFSEWIKVHKLIGSLLRENNIGFVEFNGQIPIKSRGELIRKFEDDPRYKIFLSTEAGGSGLNLQVADTLINFELPWNPAKKNQRIGRIDRIGQRSNNLTIYNFITCNSIEQQISSGLLVKQSLFDGVLGGSSTTDFVDFSSKGRSQFIQQMEEFIAQTEKWEKEEEPVYEPLQKYDEQYAETEESISNDEVSFSGNSVEQKSEKQESEKMVEENIKKQTDKTRKLETVMNSGMQFLSGLYKMTTGKDMAAEDRHIEINTETGEVTMKFKLPF
ncbi:MAG TPA: hypothetical protein DF818_00865 [Bacteroidales bacterium]|nr:hypothetical protein [Bacteroidales bacterium]